MLLSKYTSGAFTRMRLVDGDANELIDEVEALLFTCDITGDVGAEGVKKV